jgi:hypothetical protein
MTVPGFGMTVCFGGVGELPVYVNHPPIALLVVLSVTYPEAGAVESAVKSVPVITIAAARPGPLTPPLMMMAVARNPRSHFVVAESAFDTTELSRKLKKVNLPLLAVSAGKSFTNVTRPCGSTGSGSTILFLQPETMISVEQIVRI